MDMIRGHIEFEPEPERARLERLALHERLEEEHLSLREAQLYAKLDRWRVAIAMNVAHAQPGFEQSIAVAIARFLAMCDKHMQTHCADGSCRKLITT